MNPVYVKSLKVMSLPLTALVACGFISIFVVTKSAKVAQNSFELAQDFISQKISN